MNGPPVLRGERVTLRPLTIDDAPALHVAHSDKAVHLYWSEPEYSKLEQTRAHIAATIAKSESWAITESGGEALGRISLFRTRAGVGEIGLLIRKAAQGKGLVSAALSLVVAHAFANSYHRLVADIDPDNASSLRLFERAGFVREGVLRQNWITHLGKRDTVLLAKLKEETP